MKKLQTFWEMEKNNEVVSFYPTISAQVAKQIKKQTNEAIY